MTDAFDWRIVKLGLELNGETTIFDGGYRGGVGFDIVASGRRYLSASMSQCDLAIYNLTKEHRNYILTHATPLVQQGQNRKGIFVTLDIGRESYGTFRMFEGYSFACKPSQPPDIGIFLQSMTNNLFTDRKSVV